MSNLRKKFALGIDVGGTKILGVLADEEGFILAETVEPTPKKSEEFISLLICLIERLHSFLCEEGEVLGVGLGIAGQINFKEGKIISSPNLPFKEMPLLKLARERTALKVFLDNDANVAALGEKHFGAAKNVDNFICVTLGTGIGGGIVIDGRIYRGSSGFAGEIGHMVLDLNGPPCNCGNYGCLEVLASGLAVARQAKEKVTEESLIYKLAKGNKENITGEMVTSAALKEDPLAVNILADIGKILGVGISNLINIFNPEMIVLTAGQAQAGGLILTPARKEIERRALQANFESTEIVLSQLGEKSGALGACALVFEEVGK
ncbi:MAG: ROK family protein [Candidatus Subteraquimicrobiales bacterium]|nr:ROK family protein [Candidatus Subteraquimicrobiales bacterium]